MHVVRVEGTNRPSSGGSTAIACAEDGDALNILSGNYKLVTAYFQANGATISKDVWNFNTAQETREQLRWQLQCPAWSDDSQQYPYTVQFNRLVYVAGHGSRDFNKPAGNRAAIQVGKDDGYLRLDDILRPLATAPDTWKTLSSRSGKEAWMQSWANRSAWTGLLTVVLDSCHSGAWIKDMIAKINSGDPLLQKIKENRDKYGGAVWISFRVSSLASEVSWYDGEGGRYTQALLTRLRSEQNGKGEGYGTRAFVEDMVDGKDVFWTNKECSCQKKTIKGYHYCKQHPQTDVAIDFRLDSKGWRWWYPEDRKSYLTW